MNTKDLEALRVEADTAVNNHGHSSSNLISGMASLIKRQQAAIEGMAKDAERYGELKAALAYPENAPSLEYEGVYITDKLDAFCDDLIHDTNLLAESEKEDANGRR